MKIRENLTNISIVLFIIGIMGALVSFFMNNKWGAISFGLLIIIAFVLNTVSENKNTERKEE